jgi:DNA sulfur modification protein DndD
MKIKNIELYNYRLYKGANRINFQNGSDKNIYLISGENGFGKTTFLHSLLWCLYGRLMNDIDDTFRKEMSSSVNGSSGYNTFLIGNLNNSSKQKVLSELSAIEFNSIKKKGYSVDNEHIKEFSTYSVSIEFSDIVIPSIPCHSLKIIRSYDFIREIEKIEVLIDGVPNEISAEIGHDVFINDFILNKDIARFFFFDSERIVTLAETNTIEDKRKLCSAYNEVLGVKKYEDLKKNLENLRLRFRKKSADIEVRKQLNDLLETQKKLTNIIAEQEKQTSDIDNQLISIRKEDENLQIQLLREGNRTTLIELNRQEAVLETTRKKDTDYKLRIKEFLDFAPFAISGNLLQKAKTQIEHDFNILQSQNNVHNQNSLLESIKSEMRDVFEDVSIPKDLKNQLIKSFQKIISKHQNQISDDEPLMNVTKEVFDEFNSVYSNLISTYKIEFEHLADDYKKNKQILDRTARNISSMQAKENDNVIKNIRKQKNEYERNIATLESKIRQLHEEKGALNKELGVVSRKVSELSKKVSIDDSDSKKDKVAEQLINELNTFLVSLKKERKSALENRIKTILNNLMHKTDFISNVDVIINDDIIDINLFDADGNLINKEMLSKGEQQLYATSLLKAFVEESEIKFPVIIDSPLQKFDKSHANKIITEFYPTVSEQVILFPLLHKELSNNEFNTMKPYINAVYVLKNKNSYSYIEKLDDINDLMEINYVFTDKNEY